MKNIFNPQNNQELIERLNHLSPDAKPNWGKINVCQKVKHCQKPLEVAQGTHKVKRGFIAFLFGKMAKKSFLIEGDLK